MKFYIPDVSEPMGLLEGVKKFMNSQGYIVEESKYRCINYSHNGKRCTDMVGIKNIAINEKVLLILKSGPMFLVCTANRGVLRGEPILVGVHSVSGFEKFED